MDKKDIKHLSLKEIEELQDLLTEEIVDRKLRKENIEIYSEFADQTLENYKAVWREKLGEMIISKNKVCEKVCREHIRMISTEILCRKIREDVAI